MEKTPIEVVGHWLQNLLDPDVVNSVVAPDVRSGENVAAAASFRRDGSWTVQTEPGSEPFEIRQEAVKS